MIVYQKARIFDPDSPTNGLYVQFNPNTLEYSAGMGRGGQKGVQSDDDANSSTEVQIQNSPLLRERGALLSVRLFFHSYMNDQVFDDVRPNVNRIRAFLPPIINKDSKPAMATSPRITFAWGTMTHTGTLESFQVTYQMFAFDGTPVQAEVSISIRGEDPDVSAASNNQALLKTDFSKEDPLFLSDLSSLSWLFQ